MVVAMAHAPTWVVVRWARGCRPSLHRCPGRDTSTLGHVSRRVNKTLLFSIAYVYTSTDVLRRKHVATCALVRPGQRGEAPPGGYGPRGVGGRPPTHPVAFRPRDLQRKHAASILGGIYRRFYAPSRDPTSGAPMHFASVNSSQFGANSSC